MAKSIGVIPCARFQALKRRYQTEVEQLERSQKTQLERLEQAQEHERKDLIYSTKKEQDKER